MKHELGFDLANIHENKVNGSISDYRNAIKKLSKLKMLDYIEYCRGIHGEQVHNIVADLRRALEN